MTGAITVQSQEDTRSAEERARAAPVSLPAGSYEHETLSAALEEAADAPEDERDQARERAVAEANQSPFRPDDLGLTPGYERRTVDNVDLGVTEERVVFNEDKADEAEAALAATNPGARTFDTTLTLATVPDLTTGLADISDRAHLNAIREAEVAGANRAGALTAIDTRISALSGGTEEGE